MTPDPMTSHGAANPFRGEARLGETRLQLDVNALCLLEAEGGSFDRLAADAEAGSLRAMREILWLLMLRHRPDARLEDAGEVINAHGAAAAGAALSQLFAVQSAPGPDAAEGPAPADPPPPPPALAG